MKPNRPYVIRAVLALTLAGALTPALRGQAVASLSPAPRLQFFDNAGRPLAGGCIQTFAAGSTTPLNSYSNAAGTANSNPVILDAYGRADIWLGAGVAYKITVRAKTTGCAGGGGAVMYTADGVIDQGFGLVRALQLGTLTLGLRGLPVTGQSGGVGVGNAVLSATVDGLYVSVNGAAPALLGSGGTGGSGNPAPPINSIQYNNSGAFAGSPNFTWDRINNVLAICPPPATGCTANSGIDAPTFSSTIETAGVPIYTTKNETFHIDGDGSAYFQNATVTATFNSIATGPTLAITQKDKTFNITGAGDAGFQTVGIGLHATPATGLGGGVNVGSATLSATTAGLYLSLNGAAPALITGGGAGTPGTPVNSVQFNNAGTFAGNANMTFDSAAFILTLCPPPATGCTNGSGVQAPAFSSTVETAGVAIYTTKNKTFHIDGDGSAFFQNATVTATFNSIATGPTLAITQKDKTFNITGAGDAGFQSVGIGLRATPLTGAAGGTGVGNAMLSATTGGLYLSLNGAAPVLVGGGGGAGTPGAPNTSIQFNNAGAFAGSANMTWNGTANVLTVGGPTGSGVIANTFTGQGAGGPAIAFQTTGNTWQINAAGVSSQTGNALAPAFQSQATGATVGFSTAGAPGASITGAGAASFQSLSIAGGSYGLNNAGVLTVSSCIGCVGAAAGANTQIQFNNGGVFGASAGFTWNSGLNTLSLNGAAIGPQLSLSSNSGVYRVINYYSTGGVFRWQNGVDGITEGGSNTGSSWYVTRFTDAGAGIDQPLQISRADGIVRMPDGMAVGAYGLTAAGALTVSGCTGCGGVPGAPTNAIQFNNAGAFGGSANLTWNGGTNILTIGGSAGGLNAYQISSYATGATTAFNVGAFVVSGAGDVTARNLTVSSCTGCGGGTPAAPFNSIQFNNAGAFGGTTNLSWNNATNIVTIGGSAGGLNAYQISSYATGATTAFNVGAFVVSGAGDVTARSIATGGNNGTTATTGAGGVINKSGATIALYTYDANGICSIGTGNTAPGILCTSDARLKNHVAPIGDALAPLMALRPVRFDWINNGAHGIGFVAQDVQKILPELIDKAPNSDMLMLSEEGMIPFLVRAVQQLEGELTTLRARIK